jgi:hypothetical protein
MIVEGEEVDEDSIKEEGTLPGESGRIKKPPTF